MKLKRSQLRWCRLQTLPDQPLVESAGVVASYWLVDGTVAPQISWNTSNAAKLTFTLKLRVSKEKDPLEINFNSETVAIIVLFAQDELFNTV